ncbi:carbohydrate kinase [Eikenella sp. S3360]|uniref:Carbohydrate kinase n=1 Tax=Eikenella glucosivorans TaxID=2766967 RepID=A0ABS0N8S9_9NEIS|nr:carbohydrate kinase [Eikenella glucosivorans]MBH5328713.1 carbohydrate kinase [Eikenella glucosivorans]
MKISSFGEVLWDDFPGGKALGGAPLNVLVRLASLGAECSIISRCGRDADGEELLRQIAARQVAADLVQTDEEHATSLVKVLLQADGSARYEIVYPCAWDKICVTEAALARVAASDAFVYGSLSGRDPVSRAALEQILPAARFRVLDVNLRKPHYSADRVLGLMRSAHLIKLNDEELYELAAAFGSPYRSLEQNLRYLAGHTDTEHICVTLGQHGALYFRHGEILAHHGFRVNVADSVGAGDSFLAGFLHQLLSGAAPADTLAFACAIGALNVTRHGATPPISLEEVQTLMHPG